MTATYNLTLDTLVDRLRLRLGDTNVAEPDGVVWQDEEIQYFYDRNERITPADKREDWTEAEMIEVLLLNEARLIGKTSILGYAVDGGAWRPPARDRIVYLRERHVLG